MCIANTEKLYKKNFNNLYSVFLRLSHFNTIELRMSQVLLIISEDFGHTAEIGHHDDIQGCFDSESSDSEPEVF